MNEIDEQFEKRLREDLHRLASKAIAENLEIKTMQRLRRRTIFHRFAVGGAAAALIVASLWITVSVSRPSVQHASLTPAEVDAKIDRAGVSMKLLLSTQVLAQAPDGEELARENLEYIAARYPETKAAAQAKVQLQTLLNRRTTQ